ncbi:hypothetical protein [Streptomyces reniochalinae]|uniref:hypothetical protein n=1 Tax=Streptomyces reniochalinae TaxID=2250578 RepID=UPI0011C07D59|nr:hypothetical protein [Streptomyces reniochalinae]
MTAASTTDRTRTSTEGVAGRLAALAQRLLGGPLPVRLRAWDGSEAGPAQAPLVVLRSRRGAGHRVAA